MNNKKLIKLLELPTKHHTREPSNVTESNLTFDQMCQHFKTFPLNKYKDKKKNLEPHQKMFTLNGYENNKTTVINALVVEYDQQPKGSLLQLLEWLNLNNYNFLLFTTFSHGVDDKEKYRLIFPINNPTKIQNNDQHKQLFEQLPIEIVKGVDPSSMLNTQFQFMPCHSKLDDPQFQYRIEFQHQGRDVELSDSKQSQTYIRSLKKAATDKQSLDQGLVKLMTKTVAPGQSNQYFKEFIQLLYKKKYSKSAAIDLLMSQSQRIALSGQKLRRDKTYIVNMVDNWWEKNTQQPPTNWFENYTDDYNTFIKTFTAVAKYEQQQYIMQIKQQKQHRSTKVTAEQFGTSTFIKKVIAETTQGGRLTEHNFKHHLVVVDGNKFQNTTLGEHFGSSLLVAINDVNVGYNKFTPKLLENIVLPDPNKYNPFIEYLSQFNGGTEQKAREFCKRIKTTQGEELTFQILLILFKQIFVSVYDPYIQQHGLKDSKLFLLIGDGGINKSSFVEYIGTGMKDFCSEIQFDQSSPRAIEMALDTPVVELCEIGVDITGKNAGAKLKGLINKRTDKIDPKFKQPRKRPRLTTMIGTTNNREILVDRNVRKILTLHLTQPIETDGNDLKGYKMPVDHMWSYVRVLYDQYIDKGGHPEMFAVPNKEHRLILQNSNNAHILKHKVWEFLEENITKTTNAQNQHLFPHYCSRWSIRQLIDQLEMVTMVHVATSHSSRYFSQYDVRSMRQVVSEFVHQHKIIDIKNNTGLTFYMSEWLDRGEKNVYTEKPKLSLVDS